MSTGQVAFGCEPRLGVRDLRLVDRAVREYWPISQAQRALVIDRLVAITAEPTSSHREAASAARALLAFSKINLQSAASTIAADDPDDLRRCLELLEAAVARAPVGDNPSPASSPSSSPVLDPSPAISPPSSPACDSAPSIGNVSSAIGDSSPEMSPASSSIIDSSSPTCHLSSSICHPSSNFSQFLTSIPDHPSVPAAARRKRGRHDHRRARRSLDVLEVERHDSIAPFRVGNGPNARTP